MSIDKPTSFDIAAAAGVSQPTVSRALRGDRSVNAATRMRIEAIARQLNYTVDKNASSLRRGQSNTLALLFFEDTAPDGSAINPFFLSMLESILRTCAARGYDLLTSFQQLSANWHVDYEDSRKADGIILLGYGDYELFQARLGQLKSQGTHFVRWGSVEADSDGATIGCDNIAGGEAAARHLIEHGHEHVAFLGDASGHYPEFRDRYRGFTDTMRAAGKTVDPALQVDALSTEESGYAAGRQLIARHKHFDAIFAASDMIAIGAMRALDEAGRRIPDNVALIGFDDIPAASMSRPPLTTIAQDYHRAGEVLVDTLIQRIGGKPTDTMLLPPHLIVRKSS